MEKFDLYKICRRGNRRGETGQGTVFVFIKRNQGAANKRRVAVK